jgi:hypothetical protein
LFFKPFSLSNLQIWRRGIRALETTRKSTGIGREQLNAFAADAIGDAFMQLSAKWTDPNG